MSTDPLFLRLVGGNVAYPRGQMVDDAISAHTIVSSFQMWLDGLITKAELIAADDLTSPGGDFGGVTYSDDSTTLNDLLGFYNAATKKDKWLNHFEWRVILGRDKRSPSGVPQRDGKFGFAVLNTFLHGPNDDRSLTDTGAAARRFNAWA